MQYHRNQMISEEKNHNSQIEE